jgi:uncharacterized protein (TIRG00374 family)
VRSKLLTLLKVAISLGLMAYVFTRPSILNADWRLMLAGLRLGPWLLALAVYFIAIGLNVLKWRILLRALGVDIHYVSLFRHNLVGLFFANLPLSMIGGDIARGWDLARTAAGQAAPVAVSVLLDRLLGLGAFLVAATLGLAYACTGLGRGDLRWLLTTVALILAGFLVAVAALMSQRLRRLVERLFGLGPLKRLLPLYQKLSDSVQVCRTRTRPLILAFGVGLATVAATCVVNYLAARSAGAAAPVEWVLVLTPLTPFALYIPSIASGLGVNQLVYVALYHNLAGVMPEPSALAFSLAMQVIIVVSSLPGAVLWWRRK